MLTLGSLERAIMDGLWSSDSPRTVYELRDGLIASAPVPAVTTLLTVLGRLEKKGFVIADRSSRPHSYRPVASRAQHMAELMNEVLLGSGDNRAVLERFIGGVSPQDAETLRGLLGEAS